MDLSFLSKLLGTRINVKQSSMICTVSVMLTPVIFIVSLLFGNPYFGVALLIVLLVINLLAKTSFWKIILGLILLSAIFIGVDFVKDRVLVANEPSQIMQYLSEKYEEEFIVKNVKIRYVIFCSLPFSMKASPEGITADVYPVDNEKLVFSVVRCKDDKTYSDDYITSYWGYQERDKVRQFLETVFDTVPEFEVDIEIPHSFDLDAHIDNSDIPEFRTFFEQYKNDITYTIGIRVYDDYNKNKSLHQANAYKILEYLRQTDYVETRISYDVDNVSKDIRYGCNYDDDEDYEYNAKSPDDMSFQELGISPKNDSRLYLKYGY